jgi:hypothetical protein
VRVTFLVLAIFLDFSSDSCHITGLVTAAVIVLSKKLHVNPDNIATPIAGSLGDITSLALLSVIADFFHRTSGISLNLFTVVKLKFSIMSIIQVHILERWRGGRVKIFHNGVFEEINDIAPRCV